MSTIESKTTKHDIGSSSSVRELHLVVGSTQEGAVFYEVPVTIQTKRLFRKLDEMGKMLKQLRLVQMILPICDPLDFDEEYLNLFEESFGFPHDQLNRVKMEKIQRSVLFKKQSYVKVHHYYLYM